MSVPSCRCRCKKCCVRGATYCRSHPGCCAPASASVPAGPQPPDERTVREALRQLKARSGSHSPSVGELELALPGMIRVDACFLSNPYATDAVMTRVRELGPRQLERMVSHYPSQGA